MPTEGTAPRERLPDATPSAERSADRLRARYRLVSGTDGSISVVCANATNVSIRVVRGLTVDKRARKLYGPQTIFLDGVYAGAPFTDNEERHYSLDHHAGCIRGFTLATCEQAIVMVLEGLPLASRAWTVYVNDPDLDSVLAAWVLMNHLELVAEDQTLLRRVMPVIRLEGVIDAHGTDMEVLAALPDEAHARAKAEIETLMARERELKTTGRWMTADWPAYMRETLTAIDQLFISEQTLSDLMEIEEAGRANLGERTAVLIRSSAGIYDVEARLKERYGDNLGVIVLDQGGRRFTLRQVDSFLKKDLTAVYKALNRLDPRVETANGSPNEWGGSNNIGGAPRGTGTGLTGEQILATIQSVLGPRPPWWKRLLDLLLGGRSSPPALPPGGPST